MQIIRDIIMSERVGPIEKEVESGNQLFVKVEKRYQIVKPLKLMLL